MGCHHHGLSRYHATVAREALLEARGRAPSPVPRSFAVLERVAAVVAQAVGHRADQRLGLAGAAAGCAASGRRSAPRCRRRCCRPRRSRPSSISRSTPRQWSSTCSQSRTLQAVAVERQPLVLERVGDEQRDDLLGELVRAVVVRRARDDHRHAVGGPVAVGEAVRAGLARRVRVARPQLVGLRRLARRHRPVDLVGRDLDEAPQARRLRARPRAARRCRRRRSG